MPNGKSCVMHKLCPKCWYHLEKTEEESLNTLINLVVSIGICIKLSNDCGIR